VVVGRLFIAVPLLDEPRHALAALLDGPLPGRVVRPQNWHLTLRFVGDTDELTYERLLGALGAFPAPAKATVLWVGFSDGLVGFDRLARVVEEASERAGMPPEERPFRAHLTLSRIRPHQDVRSVVARPPLAGVSWMVDEVDVFRSHLGPGGPRYERLERYMLGGEHMFD
jgi:2'-5' RNA ligase